MLFWELGGTGGKGGESLLREAEVVAIPATLVIRATSRAQEAAAHAVCAEGAVLHEVVVVGRRRRVSTREGSGPRLGASRTPAQILRRMCRDPTAPSGRHQCGKERGARWFLEFRLVEFACVLVLHKDLEARFLPHHLVSSSAAESKQQQQEDGPRGRSPPQAPIGSSIRTSRSRACPYFSTPFQDAIRRPS